MQVNDDFFDELFARKLGNMEVSPPADGWFRIQSELDKHGGMKIKYWLTAASFALIVSVMASIIYFQSRELSGGEHVTQQHLAVIEEQQYQIEALQQTLDELQSYMAVLSQNNTSVSSQITAELPQITVELAQSAVESPQIAAELPQDVILAPLMNVALSQIIDELIQANNDLVLVFEEQSTIAEELPFTAAAVVVENTHSIADNINPRIQSPNLQSLVLIYDDDVLRAPQQRWEVSGQIAPMQSYRNVSSVPAGLRKSDFDDAESPLLAYSGGVSVSYKVFNRLSVQTGAFYTQMGQSINSVSPVTNMYAAVSSNNSYSKNFVRTSSGSAAVVSNLKSDVNSTYSTFFNAGYQETSSRQTSSNSGKYQLIERVDYLEIPLALRYKLVDSKFSFIIISGMSANILLDTNIFVDNGEELLKSGTILMARPINYSTTFGLGMGYQIMPNMTVGIEPVFKYFLHPYTTSSQVGSNPYAFGVFTGAVYSF